MWPDERGTWRFDSGKLLDIFIDKIVNIHRETTFPQPIMLSKTLRNGCHKPHFTTMPVLHPSFIFFIGHHEDENTTKGTPDCAGSHQFGSASPVPKSLVSLSWNNRHALKGRNVEPKLGGFTGESPQKNGAILGYCTKTNGQKESRNNLEKQVDPCFFI